MQGHPLPAEASEAGHPAEQRPGVEAGPPGVPGQDLQPEGAAVNHEMRSLQREKAMRTALVVVKQVSLFGA